MSSSSLTSRKQLRTGDERQLFRPDQLKVGMHIGVVSVQEGLGKPMRALQAAVGFTGLLGRDEEQSRRAVARDGWQHKGLEGILPMWHGTIYGSTDTGVWVNLIGQRPERSSLKDFMNIDPTDLPDIDRPARSFNAYNQIGLAAITDVRIDLYGLDVRRDIGHWNNAATLRLDQ